MLARVKVVENSVQQGKQICNAIDELSKIHIKAVKSDQTVLPVSSSTDDSSIDTSEGNGRLHITSNDFILRKSELAIQRNVTEKKVIDHSAEISESLV